MMSILLLTLLSKLHCHPGVMFSVSLLPVENVVWSAVLNEPSEFVAKSRSKPEFVKPAVSDPETGFPDESKKLSQSSACVVPPTLVVVLARTSPSSWNCRSWTAYAMTGTSSAKSKAEITSSATRSRRRPPGLPIDDALELPPISLLHHSLDGAV